MLRHAALTLALLATAGCAQISGPSAEAVAACRAGDWDRFGENDGRLGIATQDRAGLFESCNSLGTPADLAAYQTGRARGLEGFCTLENGYEIGLSGRRYDGVCPPNLATDFLQGFNRGRAERPVGAVLGEDVRVGLGIGIGSRGRVRTGLGIGIGLGGYGFGHRHGFRYGNRFGAWSHHRYRHW